MLKSFTVNNIKEVEQLEQKLFESMNKALLQISSEITSNCSQTLFSKMKFGGIVNSLQKSYALDEYHKTI